MVSDIVTHVTVMSPSQLNVGDSLVQGGVLASEGGMANQPGAISGHRQSLIFLNYSVLDQVPVGRSKNHRAWWVRYFTGPFHSITQPAVSKN